ncbi:hypothetical protein ACR9KO_06130 [Helicobacter pylori]
MAYYENITAGRGAIDSFANALERQRFANLMLNETISNFSNNITRAGALFDEARIREDALKYQRMQDFYNNKRKDEAFELEKKQAELSMDFAKRQQAMNEKMHRQNNIVKSHQAQALALQNKLNQKQHEWLMEVIPNDKAIVAAKNKANNTPITPTNALNAQGTPKPKTITKEEFRAIYANPMFRF